MPYKIVEGKRQQGTTLIQAPRGEHSEKPEEMRRYIEKVSDREGYNKLEMFARKKSDGWDIWSNELENDVVIGEAPEKKTIEPPKQIIGTLFN